MLAVRFDSFAIVALLKFFHWWCQVIYLSENVLIFWKVHFRKCSCTVFLHTFPYNFIAIPVSCLSSCWHSLKSHVNLWKGSKEIFQRALQEYWSKEGIKLFFFFKKLNSSGFMSACCLHTIDNSSKMSVDFIFEGLHH